MSSITGRTRNIGFHLENDWTREHIANSLERSMNQGNGIQVLFAICTGSSELHGNHPQIYRQLVGRSRKCLLQHT